MGVNKIIQAMAELLRTLELNGEWQEGDCIVVQKTADGAEISHDKSNRKS